MAWLKEMWSFVLVWRTGDGGRSVCGCFVVESGGKKKGRESRGSNHGQDTREQLQPAGSDRRRDGTGRRTAVQLLIRYTRTCKNIRGQNQGLDTEGTHTIQCVLRCTHLHSFDWYSMEGTQNVDLEKHINNGDICFFCKWAIHTDFKVHVVGGCGLHLN